MDTINNDQDAIRGNDDTNPLANRKIITWEEIRQHSTKKDRWIVIDKRVYDITRWVKHPGGQVLLNHYAGQDATVRISLKLRDKLFSK